MIMLAQILFKNCWIHDGTVSHSKRMHPNVFALRGALLGSPCVCLPKATTLPVISVNRRRAVCDDQLISMAIGSWSISISVTYTEFGQTVTDANRCKRQVRWQKDRKH